MHRIMILQRSASTISRFTTGLTNPLDDIQPFIQVPVISQNDWTFKPREQDVEKVQPYFSKNIVALRGVADMKQLPELTVPEVCFIGRSNIGKSSLIKALFHSPAHVRISVSKKAGHTTVVKVYLAENRFGLVDMPGYGYNMPSYFESSVENYLKDRTNLSRTFLLIDSSCGINDVDKIGVGMLEEFGRPYTVVLTKIDKNKMAALYRMLQEFTKFREKNMPGCFPQPFLVSAEKDYGVGFLRAFIAHVTGNLEYKE